MANIDTFIVTRQSDKSFLQYVILEWMSYCPDDMNFPVMTTLMALSLINSARCFHGLTRLRTSVCPSYHTIGEFLPIW